jgi:hypothetical protein
MSWHILEMVTHDGIGPVEVMAAACDDGIGILARWVRRDDGSGWDVFAMDTEGAGLLPVTDFGEEECVPPEPPTTRNAGFGPEGGDK